MNKEFLLELGVEEEAAELIIDAHEVALAELTEALQETVVADGKPKLVIPPCGAVGNGVGKVVPGVL